ncbi:YncE family protein [Phenylobacterium aquaticum]|uniref:YncE family protein n=1 Tax=Phenylobacterium aquaticum TaxID=1763816 RepID=UPI001F5D1545|nr:hypothetical protein [Phenylobacterium aquaticum]MCI3131190.1 hypothetical protein [Phenylobacterium aquaticum]
MSRLRAAARATLLAAGLWASAAGVSLAGAAPSAGDYRLVDRIPAGDGSFDYISLDAARGRLFIGRDDRVSAIDLAPRRSVDRLLAGDTVHASLVLPGGRVLSTLGGADEAVLFDGATGAVLARAATGDHPDAAAYDPATGSAWVADYLGGDMTVLDARTGRATDRIAQVGPHPESPVADGHGRLFVNTGSGEVHAVLVIDTRSRKVTARYPLTGCRSASGLTYVSRNDSLVSVCRNGLAIALSARDGRELGRVTIGGDADGALYDAARGLVLIPSGEAGVLEVLRPGGPQGLARVAAVPTRVGSATAALDPGTGRVYLPSADFDPPAREGDDPVPRPGTFQVLVLAPPDAAP